MTTSKPNSHAYVQYMTDKEKEIIPLSQCVNAKGIACGKMVEVNWLNEETGKCEVYEAYVHFLGTSEEDVEVQLQKAVDNGTRLKLPSQKVLDNLTGNTESDCEFEKSKKLKMDAAKNTVRKEIIANKKETLLLESREKLTLEESYCSDKENSFTEKSNEEIVATSNESSRKGQDGKKDSSEKNEGDGTSNVNLEKVNLNMFDTLNDQTYLGGGIWIESQEWKAIDQISQHGPFIIALITAIWGDNLKNMCINKQKARPREESQIRKQISKRKLKALEAVFRDKLERQKYKGKTRLDFLVKKVRTTLSHKINDLNKKKEKKAKTDSDSDESM